MIKGIVFSVRRGVGRRSVFLVRRFVFWIVLSKSIFFLFSDVVLFVGCFGFGTRGFIFGFVLSVGDGRV